MRAGQNTMAHMSERECFLVTSPVSARWPLGYLVPRCDASATPVATRHHMAEGKGPSAPTTHNDDRMHSATTALDGQGTTRRQLSREGPHHALGRGPVAAAGAVAAACSGGLPASLTSGAGEADGNKSLCCMALTFLRVGQRHGGRRREGTKRRRQARTKATSGQWGGAPTRNRPTQSQTGWVKRECEKRLGQAKTVRTSHASSTVQREPAPVTQVNLRHVQHSQQEPQLSRNRILVAHPPTPPQPPLTGLKSKGNVQQLRLVVAQQHPRLLHELGLLLQILLESVNLLCPHTTTRRPPCPPHKMPPSSHQRETKPLSRSYPCVRAQRRARQAVRHDRRALQGTQGDGRKNRNGGVHRNRPASYLASFGLTRFRTTTQPPSFIGASR